MDFSHIIAELNAQINRLSTARNLLMETDSIVAEAIESKRKKTPEVRKRKNLMSAEGRERIVSAPRRRWEKSKAS